MTTTLNKIREHNPCKSGWETLLKSLNKTKPDDEPIAISHIIESNGLDDAIWCLRAVEGHDREIRLFAVFCARQVEHLLTDQRSIEAINTAERYANGEATKYELEAAYSAAYSAAGVAAWEATWEATWAAAWEAAWEARSALAAVLASVEAAQKEELLRICNADSNSTGKN